MVERLVRERGFNKTSNSPGTHSFGVSGGCQWFSERSSPCTDVCGSRMDQLHTTRFSDNGDGFCSPEGHSDSRKLRIRSQPAHTALCDGLPAQKMGMSVSQSGRGCRFYVLSHDISFLCCALRYLYTLLPLRCSAGRSPHPVRQRPLTVIYPTPYLACNQRHILFREVEPHTGGTLAPHIYQTGCPIGQRFHGRTQARLLL